jgi:hypothetical protein
MNVLYLSAFSCNLVYRSAFVVVYTDFNRFNSLYNYSDYSFRSNERDLHSDVICHGIYVRLFVKSLAHCTRDYEVQVRAKYSCT